MNAHVGRTPTLTIASTQAPPLHVLLGGVRVGSLLSFSARSLHSSACHLVSGLEVVGCGTLRGAAAAYTRAVMPLHSHVREYNKG